MGNRHLFELINAPPGLDGWHLGLGLLLARGVIWLAACGMVLAWLRSDRAGRLELLQCLAAVLLALVLAQLIEVFWPQPRPFVLRLGRQYIEHEADAGLPSEPVTTLWAAGLAALRSRRFGLLAFPLLTLGLLVGWSEVYLGVHFPYDIAAALPVAGAGALAARVCAPTLTPVALRLVFLSERLERWILRGTRPGGGR